MDTLIIVIHVLACVFLIAVILLQTGHEGMGAIFGGGSSTMFGGSGAGGLLSKITAGLATVFLITSLTYSVVSGNKVSDSDSIMMQGADVVEPIIPADQKPGIKFEDSGVTPASE